MTIFARFRQWRRRVFVEGGGSNALVPVPPGETAIPVQDLSWYSSGTVVSGPQRITYTSTFAGGFGALVGTAVTPTNALTATLTPSSGITVGTHDWAVSFGTAAGRTLPGPRTTRVVGSATPAPTSTSTAALGAGGSVDNGLHEYEVTFVTASGETTPGPVSNSVTTGGTAASPPSSAPSVNSFIGVTAGGTGADSGTHNYAITFVMAGIETAAGPQLALGSSDIGSPAGLGSLTAIIAGGSMTSGTYSYFMSYVSAAGETLAPIINSVVLAGAADAVSLMDLQTSSDSRVTARRLYRYDPSDGAYPSTARLVGTISNNTATTFTDMMATASRGAFIPTVSTACYHTVPLVNIPTGPGGTTARKVYRTVANGSQLKLLHTINDNTTTAYTDPSTPDASLGANVPSGTTLNTVNVSDIPIGGVVVTSRKLYRRFNGSGTFKLVTTIANNSATTYTDTTANSGLGAAAPTSNTAVNNAADLTDIPIGPAGTTFRDVWRTPAGSAQLKLLVTLANNTTTTYTDTTADGSLGANVHTSDTSGLTSIGEVSANSTSIPVTSLQPFINTGAYGGNGGWVLIGGQYVKYLDGSNLTLTGVPASGYGALATSVRYGTQVVAVPMLVGIPASGTGAVLYDIGAGDAVNLLVQCDDVAAQTALAAMEGGGDGIVEHTIQDRRLSKAEALSVGTADLAMFSTPIVTIQYATRDPKTRSGKTVHVNLPSLGLYGDFIIQSVTIDQIGLNPTLFPRYTVEASSSRFSFEDVLRKIRLDR